MRRLVNAIVIVVAAAVILTLLLWWPIYKYNDCRRVGHSVLYCVGEHIL